MSKTAQRSLVALVAAIVIFGGGILLGSLLFGSDGADVDLELGSEPTVQDDRIPSEPSTAPPATTPPATTPPSRDEAPAPFEFPSLDGLGDPEQLLEEFLGPDFDSEGLLEDLLDPNADPEQLLEEFLGPDFDPEQLLEEFLGPDFDAEGLLEGFLDPNADPEQLLEEFLGPDFDPEQLLEDFLGPGLTLPPEFGLLPDFEGAPVPDDFGDFFGQPQDPFDGEF